MTQNALNQKGFTLAELLIAILLLTVGIFAVINMQIAALRSNSIANKVSAATNLAQEVTEDILSWDSANPSFTSSTVNATYQFYNPATGTSSNTIFIPAAGTYSAVYTTTINPVVDGTATSGVVQIVVSVSGGGLQQPVSLMTYKRVT